jgi:hypothetical protein
MKLMKGGLLFALSWALGLGGNAQEVDNQLWFNYALTIKTQKPWSYGGDVGLRGFISNRDFNQILVRPTVSYKANRTFRLSAAVAYFATFNVYEYNIGEFRLHQEISIKWPTFNNFYLFWRVRLDERWFFYENLPNNFNVRGRLLGGIQTRDLHPFKMKRAIYLQAMYEGFQTFDNQGAVEFFINNARIQAALGYRLSNSWRFEIRYIWQQSRFLESEGLQTSQHILRIRAFHTITSKKRN